eukprot:11226924-Lingulodinium_polyedra.AAC.1
MLTCCCDCSVARTFANERTLTNTSNNWHYVGLLSDWGQLVGCVLGWLARTPDCMLNRQMERYIAHAYGTPTYPNR